MTTKDRFFTILGGAVAIVILSVFVYHIGFIETLLFYAGFSVVMLIGLMVLSLLIGIIYYLTIFRSKFYIKKLRAAGYDVVIDTYEVKSFATMVLMSLFFVPAAFFVTTRVWSIHTCVQAGECIVIKEWYYITPFLVTLLCLMAIVSVSAVIHGWYTSFRPIKKYYKYMKVGNTLDLPRLK